MAYPVIHGIVISQNIGYWIYYVIYYIAIRLGFEESYSKSQTLSDTPDIVRVPEVAVVEFRLDTRVGRGEPNIPRTLGETKSAGYPCRPVGWDFACPISRAHARNSFLPFVHYVASPQDHIVGLVRPS